MISYQPKQVTTKLLTVLSPRARDVLLKRYGLDKSGQIKTLESIGRVYGITRERVRQIENYGLATIQKSPLYEEHRFAFDEVQAALEELGAGLVPEEIILDTLAVNSADRNHVYFLLHVGDSFYRKKENPAYAHRWYTEKKVAETVEAALRSVRRSLDREALLSETELLERFSLELKDLKCQYDAAVLKRWLALSKEIASNPLGEWGHSDSPNVRVKGVRDYAYLVVKRHGSPMHFREVAAAIEELFGRKAHTATTHNELIKDSRFVLVGRGLYALTEWGYSAGVVKDVLRDILEKHGPLTRDEIIDRVRKERYVKDSTIIVNLQDSNLFRRFGNGTYMVLD